MISEDGFDDFNELEFPKDFGKTATFLLKTVDDELDGLEFDNPITQERLTQLRHKRSPSRTPSIKHSNTTSTSATSEVITDSMTDDPFDENDDKQLDTLDAKIPKTIWKTQKPTLIRPTQGNEKKVVGNMVYNPTLKKWEGNEDALRLFDRQNQVRPNLITNNSRDIPQSVGKMYFDPVKMCWIGNEDEDIFKLMDDEAPLTQSNPSSPAVNTTDDKFAFRVGTEFKLSSQLKNQMTINESLHKSFMSKWCPTEEKRPARGSLFCQSIRVTHLYDIRTLALSISAKNANK